MRRWLITSMLSIVTISLIFWWMQRTYGLHLKALLKVHPGWLLLGLGLSFVDLWLRSARIQLVSHQIKSPIRLRHCFRIIMAVDFFAAITPSRIGGEPARIAGFLQAGLKVSHAVLLAGVELLMDLGYLLIALPIFVVLSAGQGSEVIQMFRSVLMTAIILVSIPTFLVLMKESNASRLVCWLKRFAPWFYTLLTGRGRWDFEKGLHQLRDNTIRLLRGPWWYLPIGVLITCSWWVCRFGALLWISKGLGFDLTLAQVFWPQFLIQNTMIYTPMPINGGLFEASFLFVYREMIDPFLITSAVVLWRFFTFYLFVLVGGVTTTTSVWSFTLQRIGKKREERENGDEGDSVNRPQKLRVTSSIRSLFR